MDSNLLDKIPVRRLQPWPGLWMPAIVLVVGLLASLALASTLAQDTTELARELHRARHQALVAEITAQLQRAPGQHLPGTLTASLAANLPDGMHLRLDTLSRHTKRALLELGQSNPVRVTQTLRTELALPDRHWMLTTKTRDGWAIHAPAQTYRLVLAAGTGLSVFSALMLLAACRARAITAANNRQQRLLLERAERTQTNLQVEKSALRTALNDSETRSRDLVSLCDALIAELDEQGRIGFVSAEAADLLARAPSDLTEQPFEHLVAEKDRRRFRESLDSARQGSDLVRADLSLLGAAELQQVAVTLRLKAIKDPVHGVIGFRLSATPSNAAGII